MVSWECPTNPREASGLDPEAVHALHDEDAPRHSTARGAMDRLFSGAFGQVLTSDYVYDETVTLVRSRFGSTDEALAAGDRILGRDPYPDAVDLRFVGESGFETAVDTLATYDDQPLSFTDATTVALVERHDVDRVLAFDDDFDGIVDRLPPERVAE